MTSQSRTQAHYSSVLFLLQESNLAYSEEDVLFFEHQLDLFGKLAYVSVQILAFYNSVVELDQFQWNSEKNSCFVLDKIKAEPTCSIS